MWCQRQYAIHIILIVLFVIPLATTCEAVTLVKDGPKVAREGDLIEYMLEVVNDGTTNVIGVEVLDTLPAEIMYVDTSPMPGGIYNPTSGIWTLPLLGTGEGDKAARLGLQALVRTNLLTNPAEVVKVINVAEVVTPQPIEPIKTEFATNIICAFCIDWEIVSVELDSKHRIEESWGPFESRYFFYVHVTNNGPVMSEATVSATHFKISGGGFGTVKLKPTLPVTVSLDVGETQTITFATDWEEGPDSDYRISWQFEVTDVSLLDPVMPNTEPGAWSGKVEGGPGGSGGCTLNDEGTIDSVWLFMLILSGIYYIRRNVELHVRFTHLKAYLQ